MSVISNNKQQSHRRSRSALRSIGIAMALVVGWSCAHAASDKFQTLLRDHTNMNDETPSLVVYFTLPNNLVRSPGVPQSAVLDLEAIGSQYNYNEVYINPPTTVCTSDGADANEAGSVGMLQEHDDANLKNEWTTNHKVIMSSSLRAGENTLLICIRDIAGNVGTAAGNLDDVGVRSVVLHYHTK